MKKRKQISLSIIHFPHISLNTISNVQRTRIIEAFYIREIYILWCFQGCMFVHIEGDFLRVVGLLVGHWFYLLSSELRVQMCMPRVLRLNNFIADLVFVLFIFWKVGLLAFRLIIVFFPSLEQIEQFIFPNSIIDFNFFVRLRRGRRLFVGFIFLYFLTFPFEDIVICFWSSCSNNIAFVRTFRFRGICNVYSMNISTRLVLVPSFGLLYLKFSLRTCNICRMHLTKLL